MKDIVIWLAVTGLFLLLFAILLLIAIVRRSKRLAIWSILPVFIAVITGGIIIYKMINKSYYAIKKAESISLFKTRSGKEIYTALFKKPVDSCVTITNSKDHEMPGLDCCIWLEYTTCSSELQRVINQEKLESEKIASSDTYFEFGENPAWWKPAQLGDSILLFRHDDEGRRLQQLLCSTDSTKVLYCDMLY